MSSRIAFVNLPHGEQITRRYMCSYVSPESLFPPIELISLAAVARTRHGAEARLYDCIAEQWDGKRLVAELQDFRPDVLVTLMGFECVEEDADRVRELKSAFPDTCHVLFGHYPTHFPEELLRHSGADYVIHGEPELTFDSLLNALNGNGTVDSISGISCIGVDGLLKKGSAGRIPNPNDLPAPAFDLLPIDKYYEPLLPRPFGLIQTARGCPYRCNFCVKSYGGLLTELTPERIVEEIGLWQETHRIKSLRFIDDTFTINRPRVKRICELIIERGIHITWACLSRTDNIDGELLALMKKAGCRRIYFGVESGSQRMLDIYDKRLNAKEAIEKLHLCRTHGIETAGLFMGGHPEESENDFNETLWFARKARLNFAMYSPLTPYPGTPLFQTMGKMLDFNIIPYRNEWKDKGMYDTFDQRKTRFYRHFYMRPGYLFDNVGVIVRNFSEVIAHGVRMLRYLFFDKKFVIVGIRGKYEK